MRVLLSIFAALLLSGCWFGGPLYTEADARPGIAPGRYRAVSPGRGTQVINISIRPDGMTMFDSEEAPGPAFAGFVPLDVRGEIFLGWSSPPNARERQTYGLLRREPSGRYLVYVPWCRDSEAIAAAAGATVTQPGLENAVCTFNDRASLEAAMRALAAAPAGEPDIVYTPLPPRDRRDDTQVR